MTSLSTWQKLCGEVLFSKPLKKLYFINIEVIINFYHQLQVIGWNVAARADEYHFLFFRSF